MAKLILKSPIRVGNLSDGIIVDELELISLSFNFQNKNPIASIMLRHPASGYIQSYTVTDADKLWSAMKNSFKGIEKRTLELVSKYEKLPSGKIK